MDVSIGFPGPAIERTECADDVANVRVIDVAIDYVRDHARIVFSLTNLIRRETDADEIVRFEQCGAVRCREPFAVECLI